MADYSPTDVVYSPTEVASDMETPTELVDSDTEMKTVQQSVQKTKRVRPEPNRA